MPRPVTLNVIKAFKRSFVKDALRAALGKVKEMVQKLDCPIPCMLLEIESYLLPCCLPLQDSIAQDLQTTPTGIGYDWTGNNFPMDV
jgi:hypothetical protein